MKSFALAALALAFAHASAQQASDVPRLKARAAEITKKVGELASHATLDSDEAVKLLKQFVDELTEIRERLKALESKGQASDKDVQALKNTKFTGYIQFQFNDTDRIGQSQFDAFQVRRARLGIIQKIDPRASLRLSAEFADGATRMDTRLKDAILDYDLTPNLGFTSRASFGQQTIPVGFDLERGDADREFPERSVYNRTFFPSERSRGAILRVNPTSTVQAGAGISNALTVDDPEQAGLAPGTGNKLAGMGFLRYVGKNHRIGISGFAGQRPAYTQGANTSPGVDRWFVYLDGELRPNFARRLFLRGEAMTGHDRVPNATASASRTAKNLTGFQAIAGYDLDAKNQLNFRWEQFDPDKDSAGNAVNAWAVSYQHFLSAFAKLQLAHEIFLDEGRSVNPGQRRYQQTTLRLQFRF